MAEYWLVPNIEGVSTLSSLSHQEEELTNNLERIRLSKNWDYMLKVLVEVIDLEPSGEHTGQA